MITFLLVNQNQAVDLTVGHALTATDTAMSERTRQRIRDSVPASTRRVYSGDLKRFVAWCQEVGRTAVPATPETLADYVSQLADDGRAPSTIGRALAAVSTAHHAAGLDRPDLRLARQTLISHRQDRAKLGIGVRKAAPVTVDALRAMVDATDLATLIGQRDRTVLVLGFAMGARRSEIAALSIGDLVEAAEGLLVTVRQSKTDQEAVGRVSAIPYGSHPDTCPVRIVRAWLAALAAAGRSAGPLFLRIDRHGNLGRTPTGRGSADGRLTGQAIAIIVNRSAARAGLDSKAAWSGHSLRRGFATETYRSGANRLRIARHGGWQDDSRSLAGYVEDVDRWRDNPLAEIGL